MTFKKESLIFQISPSLPKKGRYPMGGVLFYDVFGLRGT